MEKPAGAAVRYGKEEGVMRTAVIGLSFAAVAWVALAVCPFKIMLFGRLLTFDFGARRQCSALAAALALAAGAYVWRASLLPVLTLVTGIFLLAEFLFQSREDEKTGRPADRRRSSPPDKSGEAAPARPQKAPNIFHLTLQLLLLADFLMQCLLLKG